MWHTEDGTIDDAHYILIDCDFNYFSTLPPNSMEDKMAGKGLPCPSGQKRGLATRARVPSTRFEVNMHS